MATDAQILQALTNRGLDVYKRGCHVYYDQNSRRIAFAITSMAEDHLAVHVNIGLRRKRKKAPDNFAIFVAILDGDTQEQLEVQKFPPNNVTVKYLDDDQKLVTVKKFTGLIPNKSYILVTRVRWANIRADGFVRFTTPKNAVYDPETVEDDFPVELEPTIPFEQTVKLMDVIINHI